MMVRERGTVVAISDPRYDRSFEPRCPVENVSTMRPIESGPSGLRWQCEQCRVVVIMPRVALAKALRVVHAGNGIAREIARGLRGER